MCNGGATESMVQIVHGPDESDGENEFHNRRKIIHDLNSFLASVRRTLGYLPHLTYMREMVEKEGEPECSHRY